MAAHVVAAVAGEDETVEETETVVEKGAGEETGADNRSPTGTDPSPSETPVAASTTCDQTIHHAPATPTFATAAAVEAWDGADTAVPEDAGGPATVVGIPEEAEAAAAAAAV